MSDDDDSDLEKKINWTDKIYQIQEKIIGNIININSNNCSYNYDNDVGNVFVIKPNRMIMISKHFLYYLLRKNQKMLLDKMNV